MSNNPQPLLHKDRQRPWQVKELRRLITDDSWHWEPGTTSFKCVLGFDHGTITIPSSSLPLTEYRCRECMNDFRIDQVELSARFQSWLDQHELVDGRWLPHSNPFDYEGHQAVLKFWKDSEGQPMLYEGAIHFIYGKPGTFKSWFALALVKECDVRLWDYENGTGGTLRRMQALGVTREQANGYASPSTPREVALRVQEYLETKPDLLVIDGFSGFAAGMGINPDSNQEVMGTFNDVFTPLKNAGITVVILDHLPKDAASFDYPIGAQAKKAQSDVSYLFKNSKDPNIVEILVSKDRHGEILDRSEPGTLPRKFGTLQIDSKDDSVLLTVKPSLSAQIAGTDVSMAEGTLIQDIYGYVAANPDCAKNEVETKIPGKNQRKREALNFLVEQGYIAVKQVGTSHLLSVAKELDINWSPLGA